MCQQALLWSLSARQPAARTSLSICVAFLRESRLSPVRCLATQATVLLVKGCALTATACATTAGREKIAMNTHARTSASFRWDTANVTGVSLFLSHSPLPRSLSFVIDFTDRPGFPVL